jgi:hypothetical protein
MHRSQLSRLCMHDDSMCIRLFAVVLENGGPWHFTIDFIQMRQKKEYESPPSVIARMGDPPLQYEHPESPCESFVVYRPAVQENA